MPDSGAPQKLDIVLYTEGLPFTGDTLEKQALGGSETAFISVARQLAQAGHAVTAFCHCTQEGDFDGVAYRDLARLATWRRRETCDLFICSRFFDVFAQPVPASVRVLWNHDCIGEDAVPRVRKVIHQIDYMYCLSDFHIRLFSSVLRSLNPLIKKNSNGIDFALTEAARSAAAKKHKVMYTSRPERGLWHALDVYERLGDKTLELLVCSYNTYENPQIQSIEATCNTRIAALNQQGFTVRVDRFKKTALYQHLAESKAVVYPSIYPEISCISAMEAQACGTVILTTDDFALTETVAYQRYDPQDIDGFVGALRRVLTDGPHRQRLERIGLEHVRRYSWENVAQTFVEDAVAFLNQAPAEGQPSTPVEHEDRRAQTTGRAFVATPTRRAALCGKEKADPVDKRHKNIVGKRAARETRIDHLRTLTASAQPPRPVGRALPKISCLTVTRDRLILLKQAVRCYCDQTYPNRELVIVSEGPPRYRQAIADHVERLGREDIRLVFLDGDDYTLGRVRNVSLDAAQGEVICQWDDDDLYHPERLRVQAERMFAEGAAACFMTDQLQFFVEERELFWVDWTQDGRIHGKWQLVPGTVMMYKDARFRYPETGAYARAGEDSLFLDAFYDKLNIARLKDAGYLHIYTYHGRNTFPKEHHRKLTSASTDFIRQREGALRAALGYYPLPMPYAFKGGERQTMFVQND